VGLFCGAALYINFVEHPARMSCGPELALREFAPSYQRATIMQVSLAIGGLALGLTAVWRLYDSWVALGAVLLGASLPFTLIVIFPTNKQLLDPHNRLAESTGHQPVPPLESPARDPVRPKRHGLRNPALPGGHALSRFFEAELGPSDRQFGRNRLIF
jgi:hypothetical protein